MEAIYSDTTHGRFIEHMDLARAWARWHGQRGTEAQILKVMYRLDPSPCGGCCSIAA